MNNRHRKMLERIERFIRTRDGQERMMELQGELRENVFEAMAKETICQLIRREKLRKRLVFLLFHPRYIVPYLLHLRS